MEYPNFSLRADYSQEILERPSKAIVYPKEQPSPISFKETVFKEWLSEIGMAEDKFRRLNLTPIEKYTDFEANRRHLVA